MSVDGYYADGTFAPPVVGPQQTGYYATTYGTPCADLDPDAFPDPTARGSAIGGYAGANGPGREGGGSGIRVAGRDQINVVRDDDRPLHFTSIFLTVNSNASTGYGEDFRVVANDLTRTLDALLGDTTTLAAVILGPEHLDRTSLVEEVRLETVGVERSPRQRRVHMHASLMIRHRTKLSMGVMGHGFKVVMTELLEQLGYHAFVSLRLGDATRQNYIVKDHNARPW